MGIDDNPADYVARQRLDGKLCAVVGAGNGIGRETAIALRQAGADVVCLDIDEAKAGAVAAEVGGRAMTVDATQRSEVDDAVECMVEAYGRLDAVVDIVGASFGSSLLEIDEDLIRRNFDLNLFQAMHVTRAAAAAMAKTGGGTIVLIGSSAGLSSLPNQIVYGSAKAALHHFVRCAASELGHLGVRVNAVAPGYVRTERMVARFDIEQWDELSSNIPLQRAGELAEIAGAALFLTQELSSFITGHVLVADGGMLNPPRVLRASSSRQIAGRLSNN
ncbi:SDR family NAD(P)-dependent oxidoreductase [Microvirga antarctica]|uniref:SDR family NAD(P)-dependent oxidoreductase n=1 Tax=Microvirga antarctica TaxID=2819233 RepID=UPI001B30D594